MERPTYTREQLQQLPAVVAARKLEEDLKRIANIITTNVVVEAKNGNTSYEATYNLSSQNSQRVIALMREILKDDIIIEYIEAKFVVDWE